MSYSRFGNRRIAKPATPPNILPKNMHTTNNFDGLVLEAILSAGDGYGGSAQEICLSLSNRVNYCFVPCFTDPTYSKNSDPALIAKVVDESPLGKKFLQYSPPHISKPLSLHRKAKVECFAFTMFEATKIPDLWPSRINTNFDQLIVPSEFCKQVFKDSGVNIPIQTVPLGINNSLWPYFDRKKRIGKQPFTFLLLFAKHQLDDMRKNSKMVLDAFKKAFGNNNDVRLVVKCSLGEHLPESFAKYGDNVQFLCNTLSREELLQMYKMADAFVFPSLGEGFGLPPREAMATGLPTILTNWSSMTDIADPSICYPLQPIGLQPAIYKNSFSKVDNGGREQIGEFAKILEDELIESMLAIYNNQDAAADIGKKASEFIHENFSYKKTVDSLLKTINDGVLKENKDIGKSNPVNKRIPVRQRVIISPEKIERGEGSIVIHVNLAIGPIPDSAKSYYLRAYAIKKKTGEISKTHPVLAEIQDYKIMSYESFHDKKMQVTIKTDLLKFDDYSLLYGLYQDDVKWHEQSIVEIKL